MHLSSPPFVPKAYASPNFFLISSCELYLMGRDHEAHHAVFSTPLPCYLVLLSPKYFPQNLIFQHPQPVLLPQSERPSFTPIQNRTELIIALYYPIYLVLSPIWPSGSKGFINKQKKGQTFEQVLTSHNFVFPKPDCYHTYLRLRPSFLFIVTYNEEHV
jgi:hypothetical protein